MPSSEQLSILNIGLSKGEKLFTGRLFADALAKVEQIWVKFRRGFLSRLMIKNFGYPAPLD